MEAKHSHRLKYCSASPVITTVEEYAHYWDLLKHAKRPFSLHDRGALPSVEIRVVSAEPGTSKSTGAPIIRVVFTLSVVMYGDGEVPQFTSKPNEGTWKTVSDMVWGRGKTLISREMTIFFDPSKDLGHEYRGFNFNTNMPHHEPGCDMPGKISQDSVEKLKEMYHVVTNAYTMFWEMAATLNDYARECKLNFEYLRELQKKKKTHFHTLQRGQPSEKGFDTDIEPSDEDDDAPARPKSSSSSSSSSSMIMDDDDQ